MSATDVTKPMLGYKERVAQAAQALKRGEDANWDLARLTHESTLGRGEYQSPGEKVPMAKWCEDVRKQSGRRFSEDYGKTFRTMWERFGEAYRAGLPDTPSWTEAMSQVWEGSDATAREQRAIKRFLREGDPEQKADVTKELLQDPEVVEQIDTPGTPVADVFDQVTIDRPYRQGHLLRPDRVKEERERNPLVKEIDAGQALMDLERAMRVFVTDVAAIFPRVTGLPDRSSDIWQREMFLRNYLARTQGAVDQIRALLDTGKPGGDIDNFLRDVLSDAKEGGA